MKKTIKILLVMMILITAFTITVNAAASSGVNPSSLQEIQAIILVQYRD